MNIENLKENMVIKNYKDLCNLLEIEISGGSAKMAQLKELIRFCKYKRDGQSYIIEEIYNVPLDKIDNRKGHSGGSIGSRANNKKDYPNFKLEDSEWNKIGVYTIILNENIYIGSTISGFRKRFLQHGKEDNNVPFTREMLEQGATFQILWVSDVCDEEYIRYKENQYIKQYRKDNNWNVINTNEAWNKLDGSKKDKIKTNTRYIKIDNDNYNKAIELLKENNLL